MPARAQHHRRPILAANWKMNKTAAETTAFFADLARALGDAPRHFAVVAPPFPAIPAAVTAARQLEHCAIAGQNCDWRASGAFTGEVSAPMLAAAGCGYVIVGHSERRQFFGDTDDAVNRRARAVLEAGLVAIVCVGEKLDEREAGETEAVLTRQFERAFFGLGAEEMLRCVLAYEPVWAIGTGRTATPELAQQAHALLRGLAQRMGGGEVAHHLRILYGGSVKPDNLAGLLAQPDIDGGLVGGASLDAAGFAQLLRT
ncbi:MAG: triose-phosphate isomerase [Terriglobales bacterium]